MLQLANVGSMDDIHELFKDTIVEFMENGLEAELDEELGYGRYDYRNKATDNSRNGYSSKRLKTSCGEIDIATPPLVETGSHDRIVGLRHQRELTLHEENTSKLSYDFKSIK